MIDMNKFRQRELREIYVAILKYGWRVTEVKQVFDSFMVDLEAPNGKRDVGYLLTPTDRYTKQPCEKDV